MTEGPSIVPGIWHSVYTYGSSSRNATFTDERDILMAKVRTQMTGMSLESDVGRLRMQLSTEGRLVTASWTERTDPDGYYAGTEFQGVAQFILAADGRSMSGAWVGHSRDMSVVNTGPWILDFVGLWPGDLDHIPADMTGRVALAVITGPRGVLLARREADTPFWAFPAARSSPASPRRPPPSARPWKKPASLCRLREASAAASIP